MSSEVYRLIPKDILDPHEVDANTGWESIPLDDSIRTPERRLEALLNVLQNGGQSLIVLTMQSNPQDFRVYIDINRELNRKVGSHVQHQTPTKAALVQTIERVGAAARSADDDRMWAITEFGIAMKPALLFSWQRMVGLSIDPMMVLGTNSQVKKDENGDWIVTPAESRRKILHTLYERGEVNTAELQGLCGITDSRVAEHLQTLHRNGLALYESVNTSEEYMRSYVITDKGKELPEWPSFNADKGFGIRPVTRLRELLVAMSPKEGGWQQREILQKFNETYGTHMSIGILSHLFSLLEKEEVIEKIGNYSSAYPTMLGKQIEEIILRPLNAWASYPRSVPAITKIANELAVNPDAYNFLYPAINESYSTVSPAKNRDKEYRARQILELVNNHPLEFDTHEIAQRLKMSYEGARTIIQGLIDAHIIYTERKSEKSSTEYLAAVDNYQDS